MKNLFIFLFLLVSVTAFADTTVFFNKETKEVMIITDKPESIVLSEQDKNLTDKIIIKEIFELTKNLPFFL